MNTIAQQIKNFIEDTGLSEYCIADMVGMSQSTVNMIKNENYKSDPVHLDFFFNSGQAAAIVDLHRELRELNISDYKVIPDSVLFKRMMIHNQLSKLIRKKMPKDSKRPASLKSIK